MDSEFRPLYIRERELIEKLLEVDFPGCDELRIQLNSLRAKQIVEDGTLRLQCDSGPPAPTKYRLVTEGTCKDADGMTIAVLLHVGTDRLMSMLEILKYDGTPIINPPSACDLVASSVPSFWASDH
jgi:hypothetical protein